jgi:hypothetical protein
MEFFAISSFFSLPFFGTFFPFLGPRAPWVSIQPIGLDLIWSGGSTSYFARFFQPARSLYVSYWGRVGFRED